MSRRNTPGGDSPADALRLVSVTKVYGTTGTAVTALDDVSLTLAPGTFTAVMGPSGSGKSTLLNCASGLDRPTGGQVYVGGTEMGFGSEAQVTRFRRGRIGFIFQQFNLLPALTVQQNVTLPSRLAGTKVDQKRCAAVLQRVGMAHRLGHRPAELSGGEQQRVAIARALVSNPKLVFADEPTGSLDTHSAREILSLLDEAVRSFGQTVVMVTHDPVAAAHADSVLFLADGRIVAEMANPTAAVVAERMTSLAEEVAGRRAAASTVEV
jgi:putative ABC transport system ATP-binding protein